MLRWRSVVYVLVGVGVGAVLSGCNGARHEAGPTAPVVGEDHRTSPARAASQRVAEELRIADLSINRKGLPERRSERLTVSGSRLVAVGPFTQATDKGIHRSRTLIAARGTFNSTKVDLKKGHDDDPWHAGHLRLRRGLIAVEVELTPWTDGLEPVGKLPEREDVIPVLPVIIYEDIETGADGTVFMTWAPEEDGPEFYVGLISGGPVWMLIPDSGADGRSRKTRVEFSVDPVESGLPESRAVKITIGPRAGGGRIYTVHHLDQQGAPVSTVYNDDANPGPESIRARKMSDFQDFQEASERLDSGIQTVFRLRAP